MQSKVQIEADTFKLVAVLSDQKLHFKLWDLTDFIVYENIGGEINRKAELSNLYESIEDFNSEQEPGQKQSKMKLYKFGTIYKYKDTPCFLIKQGGVIIIYVSMNIKSNKVTFQSQLHLNKIQEMSDFYIEEQMKKREQQQEINQQNMPKLTNKKLNKIINKLEKLEKLEEMVKMLIGNQTSHELKKTNYKQIKNTPTFSTPTKNKTTPESNKVLNMSYLTALTQANLSHFKIKSRLIQYASDTAWTSMFFNAFILSNATYAFRFKIIRIHTHNNLMMGVADYEKQKNQRYSHSSKNEVFFYTSQTELYEYSSTKQGDEIGLCGKQGDIYEVQVNLAEKKLQFLVNGQKKGQITDPILADKSRLFVPCIEFYHKNDIIELMEF